MPSLNALHLLRWAPERFVASSRERLPAYVVERREGAHQEPRRPPSLLQARVNARKFTLQGAARHRRRASSSRLRPRSRRSLGSRSARACKAPLEWLLCSIGPVRMVEMTMRAVPFGSSRSSSTPVTTAPSTQSKLTRHLPELRELSITLVRVVGLRSGLHDVSFDLDVPDWNHFVTLNYVEARVTEDRPPRIVRWHRHLPAGCTFSSGSRRSSRDASSRSSRLASKLDKT